MVRDLLSDLVDRVRTDLEVVLTLNLREDDPPAVPFKLKVLRNSSPKGFAANHNAAFQCAVGEYFCVMNPDIRMDSDPFPPLIDELKRPSVGAVAPLIVGPTGEVEDSARPFPTPCSILRKAFGEEPGKYYDIRDEPISPDWVGGMFMLFKRATFGEMGGFNAAYHLYYEDVDLCARLRSSGYDIRLTPGAKVVHLAQRRSRRDAKYFAWHLQSMTRFFASGVSRRKRMKPST
jgi:N-acetylglucosaminyl-diphospho-decaprenol L-rhamnosyltransferase